MDEYQGIRKQSRDHGLPDVHCHDFYEVQFILSAYTTVYVDNRVYGACPDTLFIYNSKDLHRSIPDPEKLYDRYIITFDPLYARKLSTADTDLLEWFDSRDPEFFHGIRLSEDQARRMKGLLHKVCEACDVKGYGSDLLKQAAFCELMVHVNRCYRDAQPATWVPHEKSLQKIRPALRYIHENLDKPLCRAQLAQCCYMSVRQFGELFRISTGFTVNQYITLQRILKAKELLRQDLSISSAAECSGFQDISHFGRVFRRFVGISPKKYAAGAVKAGAVKTCENAEKSRPDTGQQR